MELSGECGDLEKLVKSYILMQSETVELFQLVIIILYLILIPPIPLIPTLPTYTTYTSTPLIHHHTLHMIHVSMYHVA